MNIWGSYGGYEGRLVICEIDSSLEPGQLVSAEYLAEMVRFVLENGAIWKTLISGPWK